ncbi:TetR-like C-terminal domain-containing protein [Actinomadura sp. 6N118]|uniref:TetR-like C-terminal domain-containing protein n=1 Tax=Actinomadura sp. 6N118 TaxID=3375151 RepID=UPI0037906324
MGRRKVRTGELRGELVSVATGLLADGGTTAVTTRAVASGAGSSLAAVNELFGGKAGLVRAIFAEGFARLAADLSALDVTDDPASDVIELALSVRAFARRHPHLYEVMFSRPFAEFRPDDDDAAAAEAIYRIVVGRVAAVLGPERARDAAIGLFAAVQGLVSLESSGLLGDPETAERRFRMTVAATLRGFA